MLNIQDCRFINNRGSAIESYYSGVTLVGDTMFGNNTSLRGGALFLYESYIYLTVLSNILLINNNAHDIGGAIYLKQRLHIQFIPYTSDRLCFYQFNSLDITLELNLTFKSNMASNGGVDIYGGSLHNRCKYIVDGFFDINLPSYSVHEIFNFQNKTLS